MTTPNGRGPSIDGIINGTPNGRGNGDCSSYYGCVWLYVDAAVTVFGLVVFTERETVNFCSYGWPVHETPKPKTTQSNLLLKWNAQNAALNYHRKPVTQNKHTTLFFFFLFGTTTAIGQGLPVPTSELSLAFSDYCYHSRIVSPVYGGTVYSGLEPMTGSKQTTHPNKNLTSPKQNFNTPACSRRN